MTDKPKGDSLDETNRKLVSALHEAQLALWMDRNDKKMALENIIDLLERPLVSAGPLDEVQHRVGLAIEYAKAAL